MATNIWVELPQGSGGGGGGGVTSINGLTVAAQFLVTGTAGTNFAIVSSGSTHTFNLPIASAVNTGKLSNTDWITFNNKQSALTPGSISTSTTGVTIGNGANSTVGPNVTVNIQTASGSQPGLLSSTDWNTFNNKQSTITIGALDAQAANANGLSLVANVLSSQSADATHPGMVNITSQTFAGVKVFNNPVGIGVTPGSNIILDTVSDTSAANQAIQATGYGAGNISVRLRRARGTAGAPTAVQTNDIIGSYGAIGYGATAFGALNTGAYRLLAAENFTDSAMGTYLTLNSTNTGSTTLTERMRVTAPGRILINTTTDDGTNQLQVAGSSAIGNTAASVVTIGGASSTAIHQINGGMNRTIKSVSANYTVDTTTTDYFILADSTGGAFNITLPTPTTGREFVIKDKTGTFSTNNVTLIRHAAEKIEGISASRSLLTSWGTFTMFSDGTDWYIK